MLKLIHIRLCCTMSDGKVNNNTTTSYFLLITGFVFAKILCAQSDEQLLRSSSSPVGSYVVCFFREKLTITTIFVNNGACFCKNILYAQSNEQLLAAAAVRSARTWLFHE